MGPKDCISKCLVMLMLVCGSESPDLVQPALPYPRWMVNACHMALTAAQEAVLTMKKSQVCFQTKMLDYIHQHEKESQLNSVFKLTQTF